MIGRSSRAGRRAFRKSARAANRVLRSEPLEARLTLSGGGFLPWPVEVAPGAMVGAATSASAGPTVAQPIILGGSANATGTVTAKSASLFVQGCENGSTANLVYTWSVTYSPAGGSAAFSQNGTTAASSTTVAFTKAGTYNLSVRIMDSAGRSVTAAKTVVVAPTPTRITVNILNGPGVASGSTLTVSGVSEALVAQEVDQFGNLMSGSPGLFWSATYPAGAAPPSFTTGGNVTVATFRAAGSYVLSAGAAGVSASLVSVNVTVTPKCSGIGVSTAGGQAVPSGSTLTVAGVSQALVAQGVDQFGNALGAAPALVWSATYPAGASAPGLTSSGNVLTAAFRAIGDYVLSAHAAGASATLFFVNVVVVPACSSVTISTAGGQVVPSGSTLSDAGVSQTLVAQGVNQFGNLMSGSLGLVWSATYSAGVSPPSFTTSGNVTTTAFRAAGGYVLYVHATGASANLFSVNVTVLPTLSGITFTTPGGQAVPSGSTLSDAGVSQALVAQEVDQFGNAMSGAPALVWSATCPAGASAPGWATSGNVTTATFRAAGNYVLSAHAAGASTTLFSVNVAVIPTCSGISVSTPGGQAMPSGATLTDAGASQTLVVQGVDQFGNPLGGLSGLVWSATYPAGVSPPSFTSNGNTATAAFQAAGSYVLSARAAGASTTLFSVNVTVISTFSGITVTTPGGQAVPSGATLTEAGVSQALVVQEVDQFGNAIANAPALVWSAAYPAGASAPAWTNSGNVTTATFQAAGNYVLAAHAAGASTTLFSVNMTVIQTCGGISVSTPGGQAVPSGATLTDAGVSQALVVQGVDQFGNAITALSGLVWSATAYPAGASAPGFTSSGNVTTAAFRAAGGYVLSVYAAGASAALFTVNVSVNQTFSGISLSPGAPTVFQGGTQQFTATALDQFQMPLCNQPIFAWSAGGGTISQSGLFTAPTSGTACTVTATSGGLGGTATVAIISSFGGLQTPALAALLQKLDADGSLSRLDMIQILRSVEANGPLTAAELSDLKKILAESATLNIPGYVQALAGDVVNGNAANATYQGQPFGNLAVNSSPAQLEDLIDKWFFGTDLPALCGSSLVYTSVAGSLFPQTPSHNDEYQGELGDCYFISTLGTLADSNPAAVENMFINNGDGTYTVRFYTGPYGTMYNGTNYSISDGFTSGVGTADYVTVNAMLPTTTSGMLVYADYGASAANTANSLWIPLAEKAYAQWNQTGNEGRDGTNSYSSIQGGWMATVDAQVLGYNATDCAYGYAATEQATINAIEAHEAVTTGTLSWSGTQYGLYADHAYAVIGYNASNSTFTLYNPWGFDQPGPLTWGELEASCSELVVANASGSLPISGVRTQVGAPVGSSPENMFSQAGAGLSKFAVARILSSEQPPATARGGPSPAATAAAGDLFGAAANQELLHRSQARVAGPAQAPLSAALVDAALAAEGLAVG